VPERRDCVAGFYGWLAPCVGNGAPHVVNFLDEMLRSDDNLRMEEVLVPTGFSGKMLSMLISASRDYVVLAIRQGASGCSILHAARRA